MAKGILVVGESGSGKTASLRNLDPKESFIVNVQGKPLSFYKEGYTLCESGKPPEKGNVIVSDKVSTILKTMSYISENRKDIKILIIDDFQYCSVNEFMGRIKERGYDKFNDIGHNIWLLPNKLPTLRDDLIVVFLTHDEKAISDEGITFRRAKRMGKLIDQQVGGIEGFFTYVVFTDVVKEDNTIKHQFVTNNEGDTTAKTPFGLFDLRIDNDVSIIVEKLKSINV